MLEFFSQLPGVHQAIIGTLAGAVVALVTGRFVKHLIIAPFEWLSKRTSSPIDDKLVEDAKHDLGIEDDK